MMTESNTRWTILGLALLLGLGLSPALAAKGGSNGKPGGGGDGGGASAVQEVLYTGRQEGRGLSPAGYLLASPVTGDSVRVEAEGANWGDFRQVGWAPGGGAIAFCNGSSELTILDRATGSQYVAFEGMDAQHISWSGRRGADGSYLSYDQQLIVLGVVQEWGPRPWGDPFTLLTVNLELVSPNLADPEPLTDYGWWYGEDEMGRLKSTRERALRGSWVGESAAHPDRAWVVYRYDRRTYTAPLGDHWSDGTYTYEDFVELRVLTLDVSSWPAVTVVADEELLDATGQAFGDVAYGAVSQDGSHLAWIDLGGDGLLHVVDLSIEPVGGVSGAEPTVVIDAGSEATYSLSSRYTWVGTADLAISHDGAYLAACVHDSSGNDVILALDRASGAWTNVSKNKYNVTHFGYGISFGPVPPAN